MRRHHRTSLDPQEKDDSSSSDEDAFSALSRKKRKLKDASTCMTAHRQQQQQEEEAENKKKEPDGTHKEDLKNQSNQSSNMRHHHKSSERAAKMEDLISELEAASSNNNKNSDYHHHNSRQKPLEKMGSYVTEEEEPFTTNLFVGNLSPISTEEQLTEIFRQFGDLYSVKIMWPRTPEEHARGRNTGFVCFMNREDAQEAMDAFQERDPLRTGHRMWLRWGKNVKKIVRRGTGGIEPIRKKSFESDTPLNNSNGSGKQVIKNETISSSMDKQIMVKEYNEVMHGKTAIKVVPPTDEKRLRFITTVASFVAKDGSIFEKRLVEKEANNPLFAFLNQNCSDVNERIYYRWRVYSFTQGDGFDFWRTDPFIMIQPNEINVRFWIPPPLDKEKALRERMERELKEDQIRIKKERRRHISRTKDFVTGRQLEKSKMASGGGGITRLHADDLAYWNHMIDEKLCVSRGVICEVMAFCFDKSAAAQHISLLLRDALMDNRKGVSVDTKMARLYLMSDILYNSQQPGVRNAFRYRDAIEDMAEDVFKCLGAHGSGSAGRLTMNKLRMAVNSVLDAWSKWSVYSKDFILKLEALFEGKTIEVQKEESPQEDNIVRESLEIKSDNCFLDDSKVASDDNDATTMKENNPTSIWVEEPEKEFNDKDDLDGEDLDDDDINDGLIEIDFDLDGESLRDSDLDDMQSIDNT